MKKRLRDLCYHNRFVLAAGGIAAGVMLIVYFCTGVFPLGDNTVLRMDLYHQYGPLFAELYDRIFSGASPAYSWVSGLGSCFLGNYFNYLSSPIGAIVVFFGHRHVPEAIAAMVLIKAALSSGTFAYYLKRSLRSHTILSASFGVLYAFCAYMLAYYWNVMWLDAMLLLPLILLGIERIIRKGRIRLYVGALALSMFSNYYMTYMLCLFSVIYFFYYYFISYSPGASINRKDPVDPDAHIPLKERRFLRSALLFAAGSILAGALMAAALLPTYRILQNCSATSGSFPTDVKKYFTFFDFFANHFGGLTTTIRSSGDDVLPNVYCGVLTILLAPLYFFTKSISKKEKAITILLLVGFYFSFNLNNLNYIWHGFHFPNDLPYRFSFMYSFLLLVMAYKTLLRLREFSARQIGVFGAALVAFAVFVEKIQSKNVSDTTIYFTLAFVLIYVLLLALFKSYRSLSASLAVLLCVCICSEAIVCDTQSFPNSVTRESYAGDYEAFRQIKDRLDTIEQGAFYRMELTNLRTRMDNCWYGYNGVSVFSSMTYENLASLESKLGMMSNKINSFTYNPQTPVYNMMHALKYVVNNRTPNPISGPHYKQLAESLPFTAYAVNETLPIAFCVHGTTEYWDLSPENPFDVQNDFFQLATETDQSVFRDLQIAYVNYDNTDPFLEDLSAGRFFYEKSDRNADSAASATFSLIAERDANIYIYFAADGASNKDITINGDFGSYTHNASQNCIFDLGYFKKGETVHVTIPFERENGYVTFRACTLNEKVFRQGYEKLQRGSLNLTKHTDTCLEGTFTANQSCLLYTSIPYDSGWSVTLDGERVEKDDIVQLGDALLAVRVKKGNHTIRFQYHVPGLKLGLLISCCAWLLVLLWLFYNKLRKQRGFSPLPKPFFCREKPISEALFFPPREMKKPPIQQLMLPMSIKPEPEKPPIKEIIHAPAETKPFREIIRPPQMQFIESEADFMLKADETKTETE